MFLNGKSKMTHQLVGEHKYKRSLNYLGKVVVTGDISMVYPVQGVEVHGALCYV